MEEENKKTKKSEKKNENKKGVNWKLVIAFAIGLVLGLVVMFGIMRFQSVAKVKGALITKNSLYNKMKNYYSIELVLENVDKAILNKECKLTKEMREEIEKEAEDMLASYKNYGYSEEEFLKQNGFKDDDEFLDTLSLYYQKSLYYSNYLETLLDEGAVQKYFDEKSFGEIDSKHILVKISETMTDDKALALAKEIITKLNAGEDFDKVAEEYLKNNTENIVTEDLGYINFTDSIEEPYVTALKALEKGKFTVEPVKTSYGYHIIYCKDKKEGTLTNTIKMGIVTELAKDLEDTKDYNTLLKELRDKYKLKFFDKTLQEKYEDYCNNLEQQQ